MARMYDMKQKEVINTSDGSRLGFINDIEVNITTGQIKSIIIPGPAKMFGIFGREQEYKILWENIKQIGDDIILVEGITSEILKEV